MIDTDELSGILLDANNEGRIDAADLLRSLEKHGWQIAKARAADEASVTATQDVARLAALTKALEEASLSNNELRSAYASATHAHPDDAVRTSILDRARSAIASINAVLGE